MYLGRVLKNYFAPALFVCVLSAGTFSNAAAQAAPGPATPDAQLQAEVAKSLDKKQFQGVHVDVQNGLVTLSGNVERYSDKEDADRRAHHQKNVQGVQNNIGVASADIDDATLQAKLAKGLAFDRVGYGTTAFNSITVAVHQGIVTLGGNAYGYPDMTSAVGLVAYTPGVQDIINNIQVDPLSPNDDHIRRDEYGAIYGYGALSKYGSDPTKPIRITVVRGNVTLTGVVDSIEDSEVANIRANSVPGVFKVTNELQVAGKPDKKAAK